MESLYSIKPCRFRGLYKMIDIKQQEETLIAIGNLLEKKIIVYAIGGTAMMLKSIKDSTLDVDIVFDKKKDREDFVNVLKELGAKDSDVTLVYGLKKHTPLMLEIGNARFDLFLNKIITSTFSENMKKRAEETHKFGKNLVIKVIDIHDILLLKSVTSRAKDIEDITLLIKRFPVKWEIILEEAKEQVRLGNEKAILFLGETLETLSTQKAVSIPKSVLDNLWKLLKKQTKK